MNKRYPFPLTIQLSECSSFIISKSHRKGEQNSVLRKSIFQSACCTIANSGDKLYRITISFELFEIEPDHIKRIAASKNQMSCRQITPTESTLKNHLPFACIQMNRTDASIRPARSNSNRK